MRTTEEKKEFPNKQKKSYTFYTVLAQVFNSVFLEKVNSILKTILANIALFILCYCIYKPQLFLKIYKLLIE